MSDKLLSYVKQTFYNAIYASDIGLFISFDVDMISCFLCSYFEDKVLNRAQLSACITALKRGISGEDPLALEILYINNKDYFLHMIQNKVLRSRHERENMHVYTPDFRDNLFLSNERMFGKGINSNVNKLH